jgi:hypothetical protein
MNNQKHKTAAFILLMLILIAPAIQQQTGLFRMKELRGQEDPAAFPRFSVKTWFNDQFQVQVNKACDENAGFRPLLIRLKNQLEFTLFNKANAVGVVSGKKRVLFEKDYIRSYTGRDFLGEYYWNQKFNRLKMVSDTLSKLGVTLAIVLEPGKASYFPEHIPGRFTRFVSDNSNYKSILQKSAEKDIPLLNLNRFFQEKKPVAEFPLFPKGGTHWSTGGMVLAADTLLEFIQDKLKMPVPDLIIDKIFYPDTLRDTDGDVVEILNLLVPPRHFRMGYPEFRIEAGDSARRPRVLAISDSYFFNILGAKIPARAFGNEAFWYYNKTIYPDTWSSPTDTSSVNIPETVESMDMVMIMVTERFYHRFDWDFTDILYLHYYPKAGGEYRYDFMRGIVRNYLWFDEVQLQADYAGIPVEQKLVGHADYLFWQADQEGKIPHDLGYFRINILKDSAWMRQIREKATINNITVDEQVTRDAVWMLERENQ